MQSGRSVIKKLAFALVLTILPATAFAQNSGVVVRDPAGASARDPALGADTGEVPLRRDSVGGAMIDD